MVRTAYAVRVVFIFYFLEGFMKNPDCKVEKKIGSTVYIVSSYNTNFSKAAVKQKIKRLIKNEAAKKK